MVHRTARERPAVVPNVPDPAGLEDSGDLFAGEGRVGGDGPSRRDRASRSRHESVFVRLGLSRSSADSLESATSLPLRLSRD